MYITRVIKRDQTDGIFVQVHNGNAADPLVRGDVVELELAATADYPGKSVVDASAADPLTHGVIVGKNVGDTSSIPAGEFGVCQVYGFNELVTTDGSIAAGDLMIAGAAVADQATVGTNGETAFGVALAADSSTTLTSAFIRRM